MKNHLTSAGIAAIFVFTNTTKSAEYPSVVSEIISTYAPKEGTRSPQAIADAGTAFLAALPADRRKEAALSFDSGEKAKWTNVPPRGEVGGVRLGDLDKEQIQTACDLLNAVMSNNGYEMSRNIMLADDQLLPNGKPRPGFGASNYWLAVFGEPSPDKPWAIQLDGHHIAVNITLSGDKMSLSPTFIGTQPHKYPLQEKLVIPMRAESEDAFAFVTTLTGEQKKRAVIAEKRGNVQTAAGKDGFIPQPKGLKCDGLEENQRKALLKLIHLWVDDLPKAQAEARMKEIESQLKDTHFAWSGPTEPGSDMSYIIQGPSLIIEYSCQDLGGDPLNHLHSMYRDPTNEYGTRILPSAK